MVLALLFMCQVVKHIQKQARRGGTGYYTANIYSGNLDMRKKCKSYKYLP